MVKPKKKPNFLRWILGILSMSIALVGPVIATLGYQASTFHVKILTADRALMAMGVLLLLQGLLTLGAAVSGNHNIYILSFYSNVILNVFNIVFAFGVWLMMDDLVEWIDANWDSLRRNTLGYDLDAFKEHAVSEIQSLTAFAAIEFMLLLLAMAIIWLLIAKHVRSTLLPVTSLNLFILGSALIVVSLYASEHSSYTQLPNWSAYVFTFIGVTQMAMGIFGYRSALQKSRPRITVFTVLLGFVSVSALVAGIGFILKSGLVVQYLQEDWAAISANLQESGYEVAQEDFATLLKMNFKFAGLFGLVNVLYLLLSFSGALLYKRQLYTDNLLPAVF